MTTREFFIETITSEPIFERVLKAINPDKWNYRPDPVTKTGKQIATLLATEPAMLVTILKGEVLDFGTGVPVEPDLSLDQMISENLTVSRTRPTRADDQGCSPASAFLSIRATTCTSGSTTSAI